MSHTHEAFEGAAAAEERVLRFVVSAIWPNWYVLAIVVAGYLITGWDWLRPFAFWGTFAWGAAHFAFRHKQAGLFIAAVIGWIRDVFAGPVSWAGEHWLRPAMARANAWAKRLAQSIAVRPSAPNKPIEAAPAFVGARPFLNAAAAPPTGARPRVAWFTAIRNVLGFFWHWRGPIIAIIAVLLVWRIVAPVVSFVTCPFGGALGWCLGESREELRDKLVTAEENQAVAEHERDLSNRAIDAVDRTRQIEIAVGDAVSRGQEDIQHVVSQGDFNALHDAYLRAYDGVWDVAITPREPDPAPRSFDGLHAARAG